MEHILPQKQRTKREIRWNICPRTAAADANKKTINPLAISGINNNKPSQI